MKQPIVQRLRNHHWYLWLDTGNYTYFLKRDWYCAVPYSTSVKPVFGRMAKRAEVTA